MDYEFLGKLGGDTWTLQDLQKNLNGLGIKTPGGITIYEHVVRDEPTFAAMKQDYDAKLSLATIVSKYPIKPIRKKYTIIIDVNLADVSKVQTYLDSLK